MLNDWLKKFDFKGPAPGIASPHDRRPANPETFEQIYKGAAVKPPKVAYGIQKVAEMANSTHLSGMPPEFKRKALLMALNAANTDESEVLNDLIVRQRALKEYEDSFLERVNGFEASQLEQNKLRHAELDKITAQFKARIQANLDDVETRHKEFRAWQESKRQELQKFAEAAALCVPQKGVDAEEEEEEAGSNVMSMLRPTGTSR